MRAPLQNLAARTTAPRCVLEVTGRETLHSADGRRLTVNIESIAATASAVAMVGLPTALIATNDKENSKTDSLIGVVWSPAGRTMGISIPAGLQPIYPRIAADTSGWHVLFFVASRRTVAGALTDADLWYGRFNGKWEGLVRVASYKGKTAYPSLSPDFAIRQGELRFVFPYEETDSLHAAARQRGLVDVRWTVAGGWGSDTIQTPTTPTYVRITPGMADSQPFITAAVQGYAGADSRMRSALMLRGLPPSRLLVPMAQGTRAVRSPGLAAFGDRVAVSWTTPGALQGFFYTALSAAGALVHEPRELPSNVRGAAAAVGVDATTVMWLGQSAGDSKVVRAWWYDGADVTAVDSIYFRQPVFKFTAAKSKAGPLFVAAAEVAEPQGNSYPATEVISATARCASR
jgi:hypothetical protein